MDAIHLYGKSAVSFQLDSGGQRWYIVGCYLDRNDASTIEDVVAAISQRLHGAALLLNGYLNTDLEAQEVRAREEKITSAMSMEGLKDISGHFLQRNKTWLRDGRMWSILRGGREVHYQTEYIMGTYRCMFQNAAVLDAWYKTYHYLVLGYLRKTTPTAHSQDLKKRTRFPTKPLMTPDGVD